MARQREPTEEPDYIIDEEERAHIEGMALFCVLCIFCILVADIVIFIRGSSIPHLGDLLGLYTVLFFLISVYDWSHLRHIKATIEWSPVSLTLQDGKKKRYIVFREGFCVTEMILCFRRRYRAVEKPFLVSGNLGRDRQSHTVGPSGSCGGRSACSCRTRRRHGPRSRKFWVWRFRNSRRFAVCRRKTSGRRIFDRRGDP